MTRPGAGVRWHRERCQSSGSESIQNCGKESAEINEAMGMETHWKLGEDLEKVPRFNNAPRPPDPP